jgi:mono/diheme cytochrome c family protein
MAVSLSINNQVTAVPGHCGSCHTPRGVAFQEKALEDLTAIARYLKTLSGRDSGAEAAFIDDGSTETALDRGDLGAPSSGPYLKQCVSCHGLDGRGHGTSLPPVSGNPTVVG